MLRQDLNYRQLTTIPIEGIEASVNNPFSYSKLTVVFSHGMFRIETGLTVADHLVFPVFVFLDRLPIFEVGTFPHCFLLLLLAR